MQFVDKQDNFAACFLDFIKKAKIKKLKQRGLNSNGDIPKLIQKLLQNDKCCVFKGQKVESGDVLIEKILLPTPNRGDILAIFSTGAYNYSMASNYNRFQKPAAVLVNNSQSDIIIRRESLDDLVSHDVVPDRLE